VAHGVKQSTDSAESSWKGNALSTTRPAAHGGKSPEASERAEALTRVSAMP